MKNLTSSQRGKKQYTSLTRITDPRTMVMIVKLEEDQED